MITDKHQKSEKKNFIFKKDYSFPTKYIKQSWFHWKAFLPVLTFFHIIEIRS